MRKEERKSKRGERREEGSKGKYSSLVNVCVKEYYFSRRSLILSKKS